MLDVPGVQVLARGRTWRAACHEPLASSWAASSIKWIFFDSFHVFWQISHHGVQACLHLRARIRRQPLLQVSCSAYICARFGLVTGPEQTTGPGICSQPSSRDQACVWYLPGYPDCSPFCWAIRFALIHKGLKYETVPWHFQEQDKIKMSNQGLVRPSCHMMYSLST